MKKTKEKFNKVEAKQNIIELIDNHDCRCALAATNSGMVYMGSGIDFMATLSMLVDQAITQFNIEVDDIRKAVELGIEGTQVDDTDVNELRDEVNKKMLEILDLMKEQLKK